MKPIALLLLPVGMMACKPDNSAQGTAVGNLTTFRVSTPTAPDVASVVGTMHVTDASIVDCDGGSSPLAAGVALSLVGGSTLGVPKGSWCGVKLVTDQPAEWNGTSTTGHSFSLSVAVNQLVVSSAVPFDAATELKLVWQLGRVQWLDAHDLGADNDDVVIPPDDSRARKALRDISAGQFLFDDADDDLKADAGEDDLSTPEDESADDHGGGGGGGGGDTDADTDIVRESPPPGGGSDGAAATDSDASGDSAQ